MYGEWIQRIDEGMSNGASFDEIEDQINEADGMDDEVKSALWLFAWSCQSTSAQQTRARGEIARVQKEREASSKK